MWQIRLSLTQGRCEAPDTFAKLEHPEIMPTATEEILRWASLVTQLARFATKDTELGGKQIHEGDRLALWFAFANRDEAVFANPCAFDVSRSPNGHLAFSKGEHFCAGAHLARLELRLMLEALLPRIKHIELAGKVERLRSSSLAASSICRYALGSR